MPWGLGYGPRGTQGHGRFGEEAMEITGRTGRAARPVHSAVFTQCTQEGGL